MMMLEQPVGAEFDINELQLNDFIAAYEDTAVVVTPLGRSSDPEFDEFLSIMDVDYRCAVLDAPRTEIYSESQEKKKTESTTPRKAISKDCRKSRRALMRKPSAIRSSQFARYMLDLMPFNNSIRTPRHNSRAFPRFNASDALMYFPSTMVSFVNSGDMQSLSELFNAFLHPTCTICLPQTSLMGRPAPASRFLHFQKLLLDMHPDLIMCMNSTEESGNEVHSEIFFKLTENKSIYESVAGSSCSTTVYLTPLLVPSRSEHLKMKFDVTTKTDEEWSNLSALLDAGADVKLFGRIHLRLLFNKHSKRIMDMKWNIKLTRCHRRVNST